MFMLFLFAFVSFPNNVVVILFNVPQKQVQ